MVDVIPIVSSGCVVSLQPDGAEVAIGERETFIAVLDHCSEAEAMPRTFQWQIRGNGSAVMTVSVSDSAITLEGLAPGTATVFARWSADPNSADASSFTVRP